MIPFQTFSIPTSNRFAELPVDPDLPDPPKTQAKSFSTVPSPQVKKSANDRVTTTARSHFSCKKAVSTTPLPNKNPKKITSPYTLFLLARIKHVFSKPTTVPNKVFSNKVIHLRAGSPLYGFACFLQKNGSLPCKKRDWRPSSAHGRYVSIQVPSHLPPTNISDKKGHGRSRSAPASNDFSAI